MDVLENLKEKIELVEREIERWAPRSIKPEPLGNSMRHLFSAGGKRLRPCLLLLSCEAVGGKVEDALEAAAAVEILHTFTLIHDDVMDRDELRRGVKTVHVLWGIPMAIIAGDALFAKVFEALSENVRRLRLSAEKAVEIFRTISVASFEICRGQAMDVLMVQKDRVSEEEYLKMVSGKTGALLDASMKIGAIIGGGKEKEISALSTFGRKIGIAFQIRDDVLGIIGEESKFGKPIGSDIREGKRTLPIIYALRHLPLEKKKMVEEVLGEGKISRKKLEKVINLLEECGAIEYSSKLALELVDEAKKELSVIRDSRAKETLLALADFVITRSI
ncbi:MAG: polyprenyl synthetase family protein [Candidatus Hadarchaeales archaeon]